ncbi:TnpV protein [Oscillospiraceae bacterium LCP25S3_F9]
MPAYKNKDNGTWYVMTQYTNWKGERKPKCKRGFDTKREAQEWEHTFRQQNSGDLDMPFSAFLEIYCQEQKPRLKESTWQTKENIIQQKILPYFGNYKINEITTKDVRAWQNEMLAYRNEENKLNSYLTDIEQQTQNLFLRLVKDLAEKENVTENLKATDQIYKSVKSTHYIVCDILGIYISLINNLRKIRTKNLFAFRKPILPKRFR